MKQIILLRHAKTESGTAEQPDHDRALTEKGRGQMESVAKTFAEKNITPDIVLCSSATRTQQTYALLREAISTLPEATECSSDLYLASPGQTMGVVQDLPDHFQSVLIVGHNPGLAELAHIFSTHSHTDLTQSPDAEMALMRFKPATLALGESSINRWQDADVAHIYLTDCVEVE